MKILFLGPHCQQIVDALIQAGHKVYQTEEQICSSLLLEEQYGFCISYRYRYIIEKKLLEHFQGRCINLHISLLPWCRGADPNLWSYIDDTPCGVTIHIIDEGIDTGDILLQKKVIIDFEHDTLRTSYIKLSNAIETLFIENIDAILCQSVTPTPQGGIGSFHLAKDKIPYLDLIEKLWWDTPVKSLIRMKDKRERERERERERVAIVHVSEIHCDFVYRVASDFLTRQMSFCSQTIPYDEHVEWFEKQLRQKIPFYIVLYDEEPCAYVRLNNCNKEASISIALDTSYRGKGLGVQILQKATHQFLLEYEVTTIFAYVKDANNASISIFKKAFYVVSESNAVGVNVYYYPEKFAW